MAREQQLIAGQWVRIQPTEFSHEWTTGRCIEYVRPRTYNFQTQNGTTVIRSTQ